MNKSKYYYMYYIYTFFDNLLIKYNCIFTKKGYAKRYSFLHTLFVFYTINFVKFKSII